MPSPINVFLCHKKILSREKDGQLIEQENAKASILHAILQSNPDRYVSWMDESEISAGMAWEREIYTRLLSSDVLLVAIGPGTSKSEWVRREIALATALGIAIVPLGYDLNRQEFTTELKGLAIDHIQGRLTQNIKFPSKAALIQELHSDLELARSRTHTQREQVLATLRVQQGSIAPKANDNQKAFTIGAKLGGATISLHVASGDFTKTTGIDVLVNSENDYMQMAHTFRSQNRVSIAQDSGCLPFRRQVCRYYPEGTRLAGGRSHAAGATRGGFRNECRRPRKQARQGEQGSLHFSCGCGASSYGRG